MPEVGANDVHSFWFGTGDEDRSDVWFRSDPAFDHTCRTRFADALRALGRGDLNHWLDTPRGAVSWVVLADQITRNVHRGSADAFSNDAAARHVVKHMLARGTDLSLRPFERVFLYMPLEHSEDLDDQDECVRQFTSLVDSFPAEQREKALGFLDYAKQHHEIIRRFGRFPHRNDVMGRASTAEELAYLEGGATRFGQ